MQLHPSEISPAEPFDIFYFIRNPLDNATYYVRAIIYDLKTGQVLATQALTQTATNPRLFVATLQAPGDQGQIGRNIVAIASVYTDAAYTAKSEAYEEQEQYYLIRSPLSVIPSGGGGGVDAETVREIVSDALKKQNFITRDDLPFDAIFGTLGTLQREINRIPKNFVSLSGIEKGVAGVRQAIADLPEPEKLDLQPVIDEVQASSSMLLQAISALPEALYAKVNQATEDLKKTGMAIIDAIERATTKAASQIVSHATKALDRELGQKQITLSIGNVAEDQNKQPEPSPIDISHLMKN